MIDRRRLWRLLPPRVRALPADLAAVIALVVLTDLAVVLPGVRETPLRIVLGLPFVLFLPGYAFIAALFPEAGTGPVADTDDPDVEATDRAGATPATDGAGGLRERGIDGLERVALSFGLSIAIVPLIGLVLNFTPWGIRLVPILVSVSGFTLIAAWIAAVRRWELPEAERFRVPYRAWVEGARAELFEPEDRTDAALNVLLAASVVLALASVGYAVAVPKPGERFTEFYILTEGEDGELVAADYPTNYTRGEARPLVVGIGNQEHEPVRYTVVIELQRVRIANNSTTVLEEETLDRVRSPELQHNETWLTTYNVTPTLVGERLRLAFLLYNRTAGVPPEPTVGNAYRELHLWVNVSSAG